MTVILDIPYEIRSYGLAPRHRRRSVHHRFATVPAEIPVVETAQSLSWRGASDLGGTGGRESFGLLDGLPLLPCLFVRDEDGPPLLVAATPRNWQEEFVRAALAGRDPALRRDPTDAAAFRAGRGAASRTSRFTPRMTSVERDDAAEAAARAIRSGSFMAVWNGLVCTTRFDVVRIEAPTKGRSRTPTFGAVDVTWAPSRIAANWVPFRPADPADLGRAGGEAPSSRLPLARIAFCRIAGSGLTLVAPPQGKAAIGEGRLHDPALPDAFVEATLDLRRAIRLVDAQADDEIPSEAEWALAAYAEAVESLPPGVCDPSRDNEVASFLRLVETCGPAGATP